MRRSGAVSYTHLDVYKRQLEQTLTEKRDAEHFLRVLAPKYKSVFVVDLKTDRMRGVICLLYTSRWV